jgi:acyl dehydratase
MGRYYEEFEVGQTFVTEKRTLSNADILAFAELSGDHNKLHVDEEYARNTPFKTRIAHGPLGFAIATGLSYSTGLFDRTTLALLGVEWSFTAPIFPGDTLHVEMRVKSKRETSRPDRGIVERDFNLVNQDGVVVQKGVMTVMVKRTSFNEQTAS